MRLFFLHIGLILFWVALIGQSIYDVIFGVIFGYITVVLADNLWYVEIESWKEKGQDGAEPAESKPPAFRFYPFYQLNNPEQLRKEMGSVLAIFPQLLSYAYLVILYIWELVQSTTVVILHVLRINEELKPGIVALPLEANRQFEVVLLNALITMSPGTLGVDVRFYEEDGVQKKMLYVHCLHVPDREEMVNNLKYLQEVLLLAVRGPEYMRNRKEQLAEAPVIDKVQETVDDVI